MTAAVRSQPETLYTLDMLRLAARLAEWPLRADLPLQASLRSRTCGSLVDIGLALSDDGMIADCGIRAQSCAVGQASAALMMAGLNGKSAADLDKAITAIQGWLTGKDAAEPWPGFAVLAPAMAYPARHEALLLPFRAALDALNKGTA